MNKITEFSIDEVEDVRIIIKAKGLHFGIVPKSTEETEREDCKQMRIALMSVLLDSHYVVNTALENLKSSVNE